MLRQIKPIVKLKLNYFREIWNLVEISLILSSRLILILNIFLWEDYQSIRKQFAQTNGFIPIYLDSTIERNNLLKFLQSFCCFFWNYSIYQTLSF